MAQPASLTGKTLVFAVYVVLALPNGSSRDLHLPLKWLKYRFQSFAACISGVSTHHLRMRGI